MNEQEVKDIATKVYNDLGTQFGVAKVPAHLHNGVDTNNLPLSSIANFFPQVTSVPTNIPNQFSQYIVTHTDVAQIDYYDQTNGVWRSIAASNTTSPLTLDMTAGEDITAGDAVAAYPAQTSSIVFDTSASTFNGPVTSVTLSITVGNNSNRLLLVFYTASMSNTSTITGTYNGVAMTHLINRSGGSILYSGCFYVVAPTTGTHDIVITSTNIGNISIVGMSYYNVDQSNPIDTSGYASDFSSGTSVSKTMTPSVDGCRIVSGLGYNSAVALTTKTNMSTNFTTSTTASGPVTGAGDSGNIILATNTTITGGYTSNLGGAILSCVIIRPSSAVTYNAYKASASTATPNKYQAFVGFANASASSAATVSVVISGVCNVLSGLLPTRQYYISDTAGAISTSAGTNTRKVGIALSDTEILVTNIW